MLRKKKGQSTVEYVILVTAVIVVVLGFVGSSGPGGFRAALNETYRQATNGMTDMANLLSNSRYIEP